MEVNVNNVPHNVANAPIMILVQIVMEIEPLIVEAVSVLIFNTQ